MKLNFNAMKKSTLLLFVILSINVLKGQQYVTNTPFDSTLNSSGYIPSSSCTQGNPVNIELDTSLFNYVSGIQFVIIIDSIHFGGPMSISPVHPGDTIILNSSSHAFNIPSSYSGSFWFRIKLIGIPNTPHQNYPCKIETIQCTCNCLDILITKSTTDLSVCYVNFLDKVNELEKQNIFNVFPNPIINNFTITNIMEQSTIKLYNSLGEIIIEKEINSDFTFDTSNLSDDIYSLFVVNNNRKFTSRKIVINKQ